MILYYISVNEVTDDKSNNNISNLDTHLNTQSETHFKARDKIPILEIISANNLLVQLMLTTTNALINNLTTTLFANLKHEMKNLMTSIAERNHWKNKLQIKHLTLPMKLEQLSPCNLDQLTIFHWVEEKQKPKNISFCRRVTKFDLLKKGQFNEL